MKSELLLACRCSFQRHLLVKTEGAAARLFLDLGLFQLVAFCIRFALDRAEMVINSDELCKFAALRFLFSCSGVHRSVNCNWMNKTGSES